MNITALRLGLLDRGYVPLPITSPNAPGKHAGKRPTLPQWETVEITPDVIRSWERTRRRETNTGLRCGYLLGLDIDVLDGGLVHRLCDLASDTIGASPLMRIGQAPKTLLAYRTDAPFTKVKTRRLLMPDGQPRVDRVPGIRAAVCRLRHSSRHATTLLLAARFAAGRAVVRTAGDERGAGPRIRGGGRALATRRGRVSRGQG